MAGKQARRHRICAKKKGWKKLRSVKNRPKDLDQIQVSMLL